MYTVDRELHPDKDALKYYGHAAREITQSLWDNAATILDRNVSTGHKADHIIGFTHDCPRKESTFNRQMGWKSIFESFVYDKSCAVCRDSHNLSHEQHIYHISITTGTIRPLLIHEFLNEDTEHITIAI